MLANWVLIVFPISIKLRTPNTILLCKIFEKNCELIFLIFFSRVSSLYFSRNRTIALYFPIASQKYKTFLYSWRAITSFPLKWARGRWIDAEQNRGCFSTPSIDKPRVAGAIFPTSLALLFSPEDSSMPFSLARPPLASSLPATVSILSYRGWKSWGLLFLLLDRFHRTPSIAL